MHQRMSKRMKLGTHTLIHHSPIPLHQMFKEYMLKFIRALAFVDPLQYNFSWIPSGHNLRSQRMTSYIALAWQDHSSIISLDNFKTRKHVLHSPSVSMVPSHRMYKEYKLKYSVHPFSHNFSSFRVLPLNISHLSMHELVHQPRF